MPREVKAIESLMKKKPRSNQCGAKLLTSIDRIIIWCLLANDTIADMQTRQRDVAALDAKYTKELSDAKKTINDLRRDVDSGAKGLRIAATCPGVPKATSSTGVDDAGAPELTPDARRNYFDHRDGIATADKMIRGMQDYIKEQCLK